MKTFELIKIRDCNNLIKQTPSKNDYTTLIDSDTIFTKNGKQVGIYIKIKHSDSSYHFDSSFLYHLRLSYVIIDSPLK